MFEQIIPGARASALTNFLKLEEPSDQAAQMLLDYLSVQQMPWQPDVVNLDSFQKKNPAQPINNLKRNIATSMGNGIRPESIPFILNKKNKQQY